MEEGHKNAYLLSFKNSLNDIYKNVKIELKANSERVDDLYQKATRAFQKLYNSQKYNPKDIMETEEYKAMIEATANIFNQAIPHSVSESMRSALEQDIYVFSGLRTHAQLTTAKSWISDKDGIVPYYKFEEKVLELNETYNKNYLQAEYNYAVHTAQMAEKWDSFSDDTERYWLQFRTAGDDKVRDSHAELAGLTLPKDDPFWDKYTTPLDWGCRCVVVEVLARDYEKSDSKTAQEKGNKATTRLDKDGNNKAEMFRFNPGKDKKIFPPGNNYEKFVGANIVLTSINHSYDSIKYTPKTIKEYKNGGKIIQSNLVKSDDNDYKVVFESAKHFAKEGKSTEILPKTNNKSKLYNQLYGDLKNTIYEGKCPDLKVNGLFYEVEGYKPNSNPKNRLSNMLSRGVKQSSRIIIQDEGSTDNHIKKIVNQRIKQGQEIEELWVMNKKGELRRVY